jgi:hypothetical protein
MATDLEGRVLERPILLIAPYNKGGTDRVSKSFYDEALGRGLKKFDLFVSQGVEVRVIAPLKNKDYWSQQIWQYCQDFENLRPGSILRTNIKTKADYLAVVWPRDKFQTYGDILAYEPRNKDLIYKIFDQLKINSSSLDIADSYFSEGGCVVRDRNILVVSEHLKEDNLRPYLENEGYNIFFLPTPPEKGHPDKDLASRMKNRHLDTEFNLVFSPRGNALVCVNEGYYISYHEEVDVLIRSLDARMHIIPERTLEREKLAVNFITLPNGKVVLPNSCRSTQKFLEDALGRENVLVLEVVMDVDYSGRYGGLRCMSNLIHFVIPQPFFIPSNYDLDKSPAFL